jgi:hypothetical protein
LIQEEDVTVIGAEAFAQEQQDDGRDRDYLNGNIRGRSIADDETSGRDYDYEMVRVAILGKEWSKMMPIATIS